jgi:hypothetical protein
MKPILLALLFGLLVPSFAAEAPPVISVRLHASRPGAAGKNPGLLFAAWNDGRVVWSSDRAKGGDPLLTAKVEPEKIAALLQHASAMKELTDPKFQRGYVGPDASYLTITLRLDGEVAELLSWHELYEENPNIVSLPGLTPLDGRKREDVLKTAPQDFLRFREIWQDLRTEISKLTPKEGEPYQEAVPILAKKPAGRRK